MPTYEYACSKCGIMEVFQSMRENALTKCPQCGSKKIERLISGGAGVIFKGDGFWETDYNRSDDYKKQSQTGDDHKAPAASESSSSKETPTESVPQPQPKTKTERKKRDEP